MLLRDLQDPFQGSFCITLTAKQLDSFEELLASDVLEAQAEYQQGGRSALMSLDREYKRTKYNTGNTLYFHLLTGPLAYNVRVIGDVFAWVFRKFSMVWHRIKLRPRWKGRKSSAPH